MTNPVFKFGEQQAEREIVVDARNVMTVNGTLQITAAMGLILVAAAAFTWSKFSLGYTDFGSMLTGIGAIGGFILALIICFTRTKYLVPVYAGLEGLFIGGISAIFEASYPGIVVQAVVGTFAALFSMLFLYRVRLIQCTDKFRSVIFISTLSIAGIYLVDFIGRFFGHSVPVINTASNLGILSSIVVIIIVALNLIIDFDFIEQGEKRMLPKDYEWFGAFGLMVTIVWLYIEILKLLSKLASRR